jgi:hypothetical protein
MLAADHATRWGVRGPLPAIGYAPAGAASFGAQLTSIPARL